MTYLLFLWSLDTGSPKPQTWLVFQQDQGCALVKLLSHWGTGPLTPQSPDLGGWEESPSVSHWGDGQQSLHGSWTHVFSSLGP